MNGGEEPLKEKMKLMKHITIALVLCAIPAMAFGQAVSCDDCTHVVSVYMGEGGLIAMADDAEMVTWVATCGSITRFGELAANDDGVVSTLFTTDNGLACNASGDGNKFQLGPIKDGGWFWMTRGTDSATGSLVAMDTLENDTVEITSAGTADVAMMDGRGAVLVEQASTGRVGILPNILPEEPAVPGEPCGPRRNPNPPHAYDRQTNSNCELGAGGTTMRLMGPRVYGGVELITNGMVYRPRAGTIEVTADLWVDETGSFSTATDGVGGGPSAASLRLGWFGTEPPNHTNWLVGTFSVSVDTGAGPMELSIPGDGGAAVAGITLTNAGDSALPGIPGEGRALLTIAPDSDYCSATANQTAVVTMSVTPKDGFPQLPPVATGAAAGLGTSTAMSTFAAVEQIKLVCPPASSSANQGQELAPDNPFPVD